MSLPESEAPHYGAWPSRLYVERRLGEGPELERAALDIADLLADRLDRSRLVWHVGTVPPHPLPPGAAAGDDLRAGRARGEPAILANHPTAWDLFLAVQESPVESIQYLDITLPGSLEVQWSPAEQLMELVRDVATTFGASIAYTEDAALQRAYVRDRPERLAQAQLAAAGLDVADHPVHEAIAPAGTALQALPELRHRVEVAHDVVPSAVYWINWWSGAHVEALDPVVVRSAGWWRVLTAADGSMTLATGERPPDLGDPEDVLRLGRLVDELGLRAVQDEHTTPRAL